MQRPGDLLGTINSWSSRRGAATAAWHAALGTQRGRRRSFGLHMCRGGAANDELVTRLGLDAAAELTTSTRAHCEPRDFSAHTSSTIYEKAHHDRMMPAPMGVPSCVLCSARTLARNLVDIPARHPSQN